MKLKKYLLTAGNPTVGKKLKKKNKTVGTKTVLMQNSPN